MNKKILINKPKNISSNILLKLIKSKFKLKKVGYIGTLDPLAEGVLVVNEEKNTNTKIKKRYIIEGLLGIKTETLDIDGKVYIYLKKNLTYFKKIKYVVKLINKKIYQKIPKVSAKRYNGIKFYTYKKFNINLNKVKLIKIYKIKLIKFDKNIITLDISCSSGTFMREIINYIGKKINIPITILKIIRLKSGNNNILNSYNLIEILKKKNNLN